MREPSILWLIVNPRVYLTGFYKCAIRAETRKISQKVARRKHETRAFTLPLLTMVAPYTKLTAY
jgi:hypothetical protein